MTELQTIMLTRLRLEFDIDTTPADGLEGAALDAWIERAEGHRPSGWQIASRPYGACFFPHAGCKFILTRKAKSVAQ